MEYEIDGKPVSAAEYWFYQFVYHLDTLKANAHAIACEMGWREAVSLEEHAALNRNYGLGD